MRILFYRNTFDTLIPRLVVRILQQLPKVRTFPCLLLVAAYYTVTRCIRLQLVSKARGWSVLRATLVLCPVQQCTYQALA